jgi:hypothetical protein
MLDVMFSTTPSFQLHPSGISSSSPDRTAWWKSKTVTTHFFAEDKSEMEEMLASFNIVWFDGDEAKTLISAHFPGAGPGLLERCIGWVTHWRTRIWH